MMRTSTLALLIFFSSLAPAIGAKPAQPGRQPKDHRPMQVRVNGHELAVVYQYRIEFIRLDDSIRYKLTVAGPNYRAGPNEPGKHGHIGTASDFEQRLPDGTYKPISIDALKPHKVWQFKYRVEVKPNVAPLAEASPNLLVCSNPLYKTYAAAHEDEEAKHMPQMYNTMDWVNPRGTYEGVCQVTDHGGKIIYVFPLMQKASGPLAAPLSLMGNNGQVAGIMIGAPIREQLEDSDRLSIGNYTELWIWTAPNGLKKIKPAAPNKHFVGDEMSQWAKRLMKGDF